MEDVAERLGVRVGDTVTAIGPTDAERSLRVTATYGRPRADDPFWFGSQTPIPEAEGADLPPGLLSREGYLRSRRTWAWPASTCGTSTSISGVRFDDAQRVRAIDDVAALQEVPELAEITVSTGLGALFDSPDSGWRTSGCRSCSSCSRWRPSRWRSSRGSGRSCCRGNRSSSLCSKPGVRAASCSRARPSTRCWRRSSPTRSVSRSVGLRCSAALERPSLPSDLFPVQLTGSAHALGLAGAALGALALVLVSVPHLRRTILEERRLVSREDRPLLARIPVELFVLPLAAFASSSSAASRPCVIERASLDPMVLLTPTLVIFGASFLALRLLLYALRRLDRRIGRSKRLSTYSRAGGSAGRRAASRSRSCSCSRSA